MVEKDTPEGSKLCTITPFLHVLDGVQRLLQVGDQVVRKESQIALRRGRRTMTEGEKHEACQVGPADL